jgi:hypothetical protein
MLLKLVQEKERPVVNVCPAALNDQTHPKEEFQWLVIRK